MTRDHDDIAAIQALPAVPAILRVIAETTGMRWVGIAKVAADEWTLCAVHDRLSFGLSPGDSLAVEDTFCRQVRDTGQEMAIDSVAGDTVFREHRIPKMFGFDSYFAFPVRRGDGTFFGTLCGLDPDPARISNSTVCEMIRLFAEMLSGRIDGDAELRDAHWALKAERENVELREQFIAVLGHDIRTPLSSIMAGSEILLARSQEDGTRDVAARVKRSAALRGSPR